LYDYHGWVNKRVFTHLKELLNEVYRQDVKSVFPCLEQVVVHLFKTDVVWLGAMSTKRFEEIQQQAGQYSEAMKDDNSSSLMSIISLHNQWLSI
jgi:uncharacterized damage-inducible protein DinB